MTKPNDEQVRKARETWDKIYPRIKHIGDPKNGTHASYCIGDIAQAISESVEAEREACAKIFSDRKFYGPFTDDGIAQAIRARGKKPCQHCKGSGSLPCEVCGGA